MKPLTRGRRWRLATELGLVWVAPPLAIMAFGPWLTQAIIPALVVAMVVALVALRRSGLVSRQVLFGVRRGRRPLIEMGRRLAFGVPLIAFAQRAFDPERFLQLPLERPGLWLLILVAYPLLSVYPQELLFRLAFCHRYRPLLPRPWQICAASAAVFALWHLFFHNPVAPLLTLVGGWFFARTWLSTRSVPLVALEHALWGDLLFTIGTGWYFFGGSVAAHAG